MTRFARAKGSKASNEKIPGEATSWADMKKDMLTSKSLSTTNTSKSDESSSKKEQFNSSKVSNPQKQTEWAPLKNPPSLLQPNYMKWRSETQAENNRKNKMLKNKNMKSVNKGETLKGSANSNVNKESVNKNFKKFTEKKPQAEKEDLSKVGKNLKKKKKKKKKLLAENSSNSISNSEINKNINKDNELEVVNQSNNEKNNFKNINKSDNCVGVKKNKKRKLNEGKEENDVVKKSKTDGEKKSEDWHSDLNKNSDSTKVSNEEKSKKKVGNENNKKVGKGVNKNVKQNNGTVTEETIKNGEKVKIVKFQGFPLMQDDAERLEKLKDDLLKKGIGEEKVNAVLKLERRKAEKSWKRLRKNVCFHCRGSGHFLSNCPELTENQNTGSGICYKCGSTEHCAADCKVVKGSNFRFAECFICKEQGHIARQCPDNPRGLYPMGGACRECGDVTHLKKDCPKVMEKKSEEILTVGVRKDDRALDCLDEEIAKKERESVKPKKKLSTVKF